MRIKISVCFFLTFLSTFADLHNAVRDYFEWGEYPALIDTLAPIIDSLSKGTDSSLISKYYSYLGVAYFSTERIGDARFHFLKALQFDSSIALPSEYISMETAALFRVIKSEFEKQQRLKFVEDSLSVVHETEMKLFNKNKILGDLRNKHQRFLAGSISSSSAAAILLGLSIVQYERNKPVYNQFKDAAGIGDQIRYTSLRNEIRHSNALILTFDISSGVAFCSGITTALKSRQARKQLARIEK